MILESLVLAAVAAAGAPKVVKKMKPTLDLSGLTLAQLQAIMPNLSTALAQEYAPLLALAMNEAAINTPIRRAAFLAQLAHESGEFRWMEEIASGAAYEGRKDLGNTQPGDGIRYKGRGPIQVTGRANYRDAGQALGIDLENNPKRAAEPAIGFRTAAWYWTSRNINARADAGDLVGVTKLINGGTNGLEDRRKFYDRAVKVLGVTA
ncbi:MULTISPECIES: glycoside hydrolase family 19 protein [unclassified Corallococcus]|uniref:glycoside hydrolase family 19 protein n=1 Tax=unclassified Corallococcus TaxID=2685029 RepID=UPI001A8ED85D|nr:MULTISPECIES: glycoside hydrolase family 19 protein [unclassified Corallococcus]MBN9685396.1 glycoside hydrolase family 19 protein [Corallococcus sp. NCSPR001]WAS83153.1 glycoside hydrolase family 19 protein [Corallococcus sp. NCRR]